MCDIPFGVRRGVLPKCLRGRAARATRASTRGSDSGTDVSRRIPTAVPVGSVPRQSGMIHLSNTGEESSWQTSSQIKRNKTNEKARLRNRAVKSELKTYTRKVKAAVSTGDADVANEALKSASRKLDKAVSKGVIHKNQAANRKSGLAKLVAGVAK